MMGEIAVLQAVRLKGRVSAESISQTLRADPADVESVIADLIASGRIKEGRTLRITPEGRERLAQLLTDERATADDDVISVSYAEFRSVNSDFKQLVTEWQLRNGEPNDHEDADYDAAVLHRLGGIHARIAPVIDTIAVQIERLGNYGVKLSTALSKIQSGETNWLISPTIDSYHTVWFELHEELIGVAGLTRDEEASAGHA